MMTPDFEPRHYEPISITIVGLPSLGGKVPENFLGQLIEAIPGIKLLCPVQFLINHLKPEGQIYGAFVSRVFGPNPSPPEIDELPLMIVRRLRKQFPDPKLTTFKVTAVENFWNSQSYDEALDGYVEV